MPDTSSGSPFDRVLSRRGSNSEKWDSYPADVLPLFVADMDFAPPPPVLAALRASLEPGVFGYARSSADFGQALCDYLERRYRWQVTAEQLLFLPGLVCGLNLACRALTEPGDKVLVLTPIYPRFLSAPKNQGRALVAVPMAVEARDRTLHYRIDLEALESAIVQHHPRLLLLCSPHNPSGRVFSREELLALANLCLRHDMLICSDEIHCDLLLDDRPHLPLATLTPELAERTVTLLAPSKTYNIAGLQVGGAVATEPSLRARLKQAMRGLIPAPNLLGLLAGSVAYREGGAWLDAALDYLRENRDHLVRRVTEELPGIRCSVPEATYLAWLDCREAGIGDDPYQFFLQHARVALSDGCNFGDGGEGFVRLNFGCPRTTLDSALARMAAAMTS